MYFTSKKDSESSLQVASKFMAVVFIRIWEIWQLQIQGLSLEIQMSLWFNNYLNKCCMLIIISVWFHSWASFNTFPLLSLHKHSVALSVRANLRYVFTTHCIHVIWSISGLSADRQIQWLSTGRFIRVSHSFDTFLISSINQKVCIFNNRGILFIPVYIEKDEQYCNTTSPVRKASLPKSWKCFSRPNLGAC